MKTNIQLVVTIEFIKCVIPALLMYTCYHYLRIYINMFTFFALLGLINAEKTSLPLARIETEIAKPTDRYLTTEPSHYKLSVELFLFS